MHAKKYMFYSITLEVCNNGNVYVNYIFYPDSDLKNKDTELMNIIIQCKQKTPGYSS